MLSLLGQQRPALLKSETRHLLPERFFECDLRSLRIDYCSRPKRPGELMQEVQIYLLVALAAAFYNRLLIGAGPGGW